MTQNDEQQADWAGDSGQSGKSGTPEFGAMSNQFGPGYNPYVYGAPDANDDGKTQGQGQQGGPAQGASFGNPGGAPYGYGNPNYGGANGQGGNQGGYPNSPYPGFQGPQGAPGFQNMPGGFPGPQPPRDIPGPLPGQPGYEPDMQNGIDMNDPNQNPFRGRWDSMAIIAFVLLFIGGPVFPIVFGAISLHRTKKFHMRGRVLAWISVIIGVLTFIFEMWLISQGFNPMDYLQQLMGGGLGGSGGSGGSDGGSVSA